MEREKNKPTSIIENKGFQIILLLLFFAGFVYDVFFIVPTFDLGSDARLFTLMLLWIVVSKVSRFNSMATLKITISFVVVMFLLFLSSQTNPSAERAGSWVYMFLLIAVIQQFFESRRRSSI